MRALSVAAVICLLQVAAAADEVGDRAGDSPAQPGPNAADPPVDDDEPVAGSETSAVATRSRRSIVRDHRAVTVIDAETLAEVAPRTTPEALHFVPGVSVQHTHYAGGAPFIRGRVGRQTLVLVDGFRLNTPILRSGPSQYLNTIDPDALGRIEVLRGAGSVLYGSDAIGGVVSLVTRAPTGGDPTGLVRLRGATFDRSAGGRAELDTRVGPSRVLFGLGGARYGDLRGVAPLPLAAEPAYDGDTQLFTGYDQLSGDARVVTPVGAGGELTAAAIAHHQLDAPRTDVCQPDPLACRWFDEQSYDLAYLRYRDDLPTLEEVDLGAMVALTHERRRRHHDEGDLIERELDQVFTVGLTGRGSVPTIALGEAALRVSVGAEGYLDLLSSEAEREIISTGEVTVAERGAYLDGSSYLTAAAWTFGELRISDELSAIAGLRAQLVRAGVAADVEADRAAFDQTTLVPVASAGVRVGLSDRVHLVGNVDQGFRAPNLDDLTARSDQGPGFQLANPDLEPEKSVTFEVGLQVDHPRLTGSVYGYQTFVDGFITRDAAVCPPEQADPCGMADAVFMLVNADRARVEGVESTVQVRLPAGVSVLATATWTRATREVMGGPDQPGSMIPPLSGRAGVRFDIGRRWFVETLADWALRQDRLSPADIADARIPPGGTPGYGVVHVRAGGQVGRFRGTLRVENLSRTAYRVHGSGVDGPGFGAILALSAAL